MGEGWKILIKVHPHLAQKYQLDNCKFPTEQLYPVIDLLITDYSSVVFDYMLFDKSFLIYAPDYEEYMQQRGCYIDLEKKMPGGVAREYGELVQKIRSMNNKKSFEGNMKDFVTFHVSKCDGKVVNRLAGFSNFLYN